LSKQDNVPHAFLFTGSKGLGKTSAARIIAKVVNCEKKSKVKSPAFAKASAGGQKSKIPSIEPCNECEQCKSITNGTNMDILEIDAASNRGIDEIRDLREKIRLSPISAKKKVYIIDEVHMLTTEAFNALLKTLEEPPAHAMFVLCTTEPHKVPATILSRCFHIQFKLATEDEIVRSLKRIVEGEKLQADTDALYMIARMAEGGFRDSAKILEELSLFARGQKITTELVDGAYKVLSIKNQVLAIFDALVKKDMKAGLLIIDGLIKQGIDIKFFLQQMMEFLHEKLLEQAGIKKNFQFSIFSFQFKKEEIKLLFELFSRAYVEMKTAVLPQLPLELAIIEYAMRDVQGDSDKTELNEGNLSFTKDSNFAKASTYVKASSFAKATADKSADKPEGKDNKVTVAKLRKQAGTITKIKALYGSPKANISENDTKKTAEPAIGLMHAPTNGEVTPEWIEAFWRSIISEMKQFNHTIAGVLRGCSIRSYDGKQLVIEAAYKFHKERLDTPKVREALRNTCKVLTGKDVKIEVELRK
ncbi:DNA polymerase III subunit gamma/tau, partial [Patescibacteria group bacterium]|nr:DNA polymerase III subunit gamma/tau [Patescibacteria group bacterium]